MKKKIIIIISCIIFILLLFMIIDNITMNKIEASTINNNYTIKDNEFEIVQKTNGGVPTIWNLYMHNSNDIESIGKYTISDNSDGGEVEIHYVFKVNKKGIRTLTFKYIDQISNKVKNTNKYIINTNNKLKTKTIKLY